MSIGNPIMSIINIIAIASARTMHIDYLLGMWKVCASAGTHEEQLIGKRLINTKQWASASLLHVKYSTSLGSKIHWNGCASACSPVPIGSHHERGDIALYRPSPPCIRTHTYWTLMMALYGDALISLWRPHTLPHPAPMHQYSGLQQPDQESVQDQTALDNQIDPPSGPPWL